jgi:predicted 3-demethylubiquinone-9 3-methyltransferase (glyoxalase superfamily)
MKTPIYPCLWFDGKAKEAAEFYCSSFKNSKITTDTRMVVTFELNGKKIMGLNGGPMFKITPAISLFVLCETIKETDELWNKLLTGGKALMEIDKYPWSERYGWLQDKYGMTWQISVVSKPGDGMKISPALLFTKEKFGKAEEAVKFYTSVFDNSVIDALMHYPSGDPNEGKVMFSEFKLDGYNMIAMDGPGEHHFNFNEGVSLVINCENQKEIDYYWNKLTQGGEESMCGWLKDKFGISWQVVPAMLGKLMTTPEKADRVMQSVLKMKKLDVAILESII